MKTFKKVAAVALALVTACAIMMCSLSVSAADSFADYSEFKGSLCVLSNFEADTDANNVSSPSGLADPLGKSLEPEEYGRDKDEYCGDVGTLDVSRDTTRFLQGKSSLKMHIASSETLANAGNKTIEFDRTTFQIRDIKNVKVTDPANTYLCFYMYVNKKTDLANLDLGNSAIEICKEIDSTEEYQFLFSQLNAFVSIQDGWNKFEIPLNKMNAQLSGTDIKRFRIFIFSKGTGDVDLYFDNLTLEYRKPDPNTTPSNTSSKNIITVVPNASSDPDESDAASSDVASVESVVSETTADISSSVDADQTDDLPAGDDAADEGGFPVWAWVVIGVVVLAVAAAAVWFLVIKK